MKIDFCEENLILKVYPTIGGCFQEAWSVLKNNFVILLLLVILTAVVDIPMGYEHIVYRNGDFSWGASFLGLFAFAYYILVASPFNYGVDWLFLKAARKEEVQFEEVVAGFKKYLNVVLSQLLVVGIVGLGFVLILIPGIYLLCKLIFVPYLVIDKKVDPIQAIKLSFHLSKGYFWTIFGMGILSFLIIILGLLCLGVGVLVSAIWIHSAFAVLYRALNDLHFKEACERAGVQIEE
jgi:uncharacterized membrane protein